MNKYRIDSANGEFAATDWSWETNCTSTKWTLELTNANWATGDLYDNMNCFEENFTATCWLRKWTAENISELKLDLLEIKKILGYDEPDSMIGIYQMQNIEDTNGDVSVSVCNTLLLKCSLEQALFSCSLSISIFRSLNQRGNSNVSTN